MVGGNIYDVDQTAFTCSRKKKVKSAGILGTYLLRSWLNPNPKFCNASWEVNLITFSQ